MQTDEGRGRGAQENRGWLLPVFALAVVVAVGFQIHTNRVMDAQIADLRTALNDARREAQAVRATANAAANALPNEPRRLVARPPDDVEVTKMRGDLAKLRAKVDQVAIAQAAAVPTEDIPMDIIPAKEWKNSGWDTPANAMETFFWAALGGQDKLVSDFILVPEDQRARVDAWFAGLDENTRKQYASPEKLLGLMMAKDAGPLTGLQILGQHEINDSDVIVKVRFETNDNDIDQADYLLRHVAEGWRLVVPGDAVEWFGRHLEGDTKVNGQN